MGTGLELTEEDREASLALWISSILIGVCTTLD